MHSHARLTAERASGRSGSTRSLISQQRSEGALVLRSVVDPLPAWATRWGLTRENTAAVRLVAGAAGPVGGDSWQLDVQVGAGAALMLGAAAGTVALPGPHDETSASEVNVQVDDGGTLIWEPGVQIAAAGCRHRTLNRIEMEAGSRLFLREEAVLGRHNELPGLFRQRLRLVRARTPIYDQELSIGDDRTGWNGPAVVGGRRALGSMILVDPDTQSLAHTDGGPIAGVPDTALMRIADDAALVTCLCHDAVTLRANLSAAFAALPALPAEHAGDG